MLTENMINHALDLLANAESIITIHGAERMLRELYKIENMMKCTYIVGEKNLMHVHKKACKSYIGQVKVKLCCHPGCNIPTYKGNKFCECHKHLYKDVTAYKIRKMFPSQRTIPMIGIYGSFWIFLHEYMNKRNNNKSSFYKARNEHRANRMIQFIAASTILTIDDIESYLMGLPNLSKTCSSRNMTEKGESYRPSKFIDELNKAEAILTNTFVK